MTNGFVYFGKQSLHKRQTDLFVPNGTHAPCASVCKKNWNVRKLIEKTGSFGKWLK